MFLPFVHRSHNKPWASPLGLFASAQMTQLPFCQSPLAFVQGFPCPAESTRAAAAAGSPRPVMDGSWPRNIPAPLFELGSL